MDNIKNKTIKQFEFNTDDGVIIITAFIDKTTKVNEFWGHIKGYGIAFMLYGLDMPEGITLEQYAETLAWDYFDELMNSKGD